jgi:hypothetical protein
MDPFVTDGVKHPGRRVGLGLPFLAQTAESGGGGWRVESEKGRGTLVEAWIDPRGLDAPPLGDVPELLRCLFMFEGPREVVARRLRDPGEGGAPLEYEARKAELEGALGSLSDAGALALLGKYLRSLEED